MILDDIVQYKKIQLKKEKEITPLKSLIPHLETFEIRDFKKAINTGNIAFIAEIKKASPSKGIIKEAFDPVLAAQVYEKLDVQAVSILTEKQFFKGKDEYIAKAKEVNSKPVLRKDFIIDEYQLYQARAIGADAVLLIASVLGRKMKMFYLLAKELGLNVLAEVHSESELEEALNCGFSIIGINNRDLRNFSVSLKTTEELIKLIPENILTVSESGIKKAEDVRYLKELGVNAVLIGETFMKNLEAFHRIEKFIAEARG